ncbi:hypothetical protein [Glutamicibacter sp. FBE19]|uniref:hypothetical protein n=1 Tax=Glutamicibacter sp. FBE19 TaxID=2761534 RepID=UPI001896846E|nr:hypothetical protein [Glutamicibacter sp. FBE19]MBF6671163.1 hypothetical protein [Glutamicibacter sp. FBE19]
MSQTTNQARISAEAYATPIFDHLVSTDQALYVPFLRHAHPDAEQSPTVNLARNEEQQPHAISHPITGIICLLVVADAPYWIPIDRIAHSEACEKCASLWNYLRERVQELAPGECFYAAATTHSPLGETKILVDSADLDG